jgi:hypothetical protein
LVVLGGPSTPFLVQNQGHPINKLSMWIWILQNKWCVTLLTLVPHALVELGRGGEISQTIVPLVALLLLVLESPRWVGVHWVGFMMFQPMVEKLLSIEQIFTKNSFKSKLKIVKEFGCALSIFQKPSMSRIQWKLKFGNFKT